MFQECGYLTSTDVLLILLIGTISGLTKGVEKKIVSYSDERHSDSVF